MIERHNNPTILLVTCFSLYQCKKKVKKVKKVKKEHKEQNGYLRVYIV